MGGSAKKMGMRIRELERLYGIKNGGDRKSESVPNKSDVIFQNDIAKQMGISVDTLQNYKLLSDILSDKILCRLF